MLFDFLQIGNCTEAFYIFKRTFLECCKCICQLLNIVIGKISVLAVNHITHLARVNKQGFAFLLFVLSNKPKRNRNGNTVKELSRQSNDTFHKVSLNDVLSDFSLAAGLRGQSTVSKNKTDFPVRCKVVYHMLNPRIVGIAGRRCAVLPTDIVFELFLSPVGKIERRICHNEIRFQRFM